MFLVTTNKTSGSAINMKEEKNPNKNINSKHGRKNLCYKTTVILHMVTTNEGNQRYIRNTFMAKLNIDSKKVFVIYM